MDYETLIYEKAEHIARITLNRPDKLNALNRQMEFIELPDAVAQASRDDDVRVLVITGAGRAFCAGGDHKYLMELREQRSRDAGVEPFAHAGAGFPLVELELQRMSKPTIAMVNGPAVGGGFGLAIACDMRMGSDQARFGVGFTRIGLSVADATMWILPRLVGMPNACRVIFTGDVVGAEEAHHMGLLDKVFPLDKLEEETMALARKIAQGPPIAIRYDKIMLYRSLKSDLETSISYVHLGERLTMASEDFVEGMNAFAEKRKPVFQGK